MKLGLESSDLWGLSVALNAAWESGLLAALLSGGEGSAESLASRAELHPVAVARVLDVLVASGVAERVEGGYRLSGELREAHASFPGGLMLTLGLFSATPGFLRTGVGMPPTDGDADERARAYQATVAGLGRLFEPAARELSARLPWEARTVLDVGCGSGVWSLALAQRHSGVRVTGLDLAPVLERFEERAESLGLLGRIALLPGDMHTTALPEGGYDLVLLANVLRLEPAPRARALLARLARAVRPGGTLLVVDAFSHGDTAREVARAVYALHLALRTREAAVHAPEVVKSWLSDAGLSETGELDWGVFPGAVAGVWGRREG